MTTFVNRLGSISVSFSLEHLQLVLGISSRRISCLGPSPVPYPDPLSTYLSLVVLSKGRYGNKFISPTVNQTTFTCYSSFEGQPERKVQKRWFRQEGPVVRPGSATKGT